MTTTTELESSVEQEPAPKPRSLRLRVLSRISIQSKLLVMLLVTSILSAAVVGAIIPIRTLERGDFLGQTALTRESVTAAAYALDEVTMLQIEREYIEELVARKPVLLQDIGRAIEERRASLRRALAAADE